MSIRFPPLKSSPFLVTFTLILPILFLRRPDAILHAQLWAEDGVVFLRTQFISGTLAALAQPHRGYLQILPRLIAAAAYLFPVLWQPLLYNLAALVIAAACCSLFAHVWYRPLLRPDAMRIAVCVLGAACVFADETVGTITNLQWYLAIPILLLLLPPLDMSPEECRHSWWRRMGIAGLLFLMVLSCPLAVIFAPLALWAAVSRCRTKRIAAAAFLIAAIIQAAVQISYRSEPISEITASAGPVHIAFAIFVAFGYRVILATLLGFHAAQAIAASVNPAPVLIALGGTFLSLAIWWFFQPKVRVILAGALSLAVASVALPFVMRHSWEDYPALASLPEARGERYFLLAGFIFVYLVALALASLRLPAVTKLLALALCFAVGAERNFSIPPFKDFHWSGYAAQLEVWRRDTRAGAPTRGVAFPVNPEYRWMVRFPDTLVQRITSRIGGRVVREETAGGQLTGPAYLIEGVEKRPIPGDWTKWAETIQPASAQDLSALPTGAPMGSGRSPGADRVGVFRQGFYWVLDVTGNRTLDASQNRAFPFGGVPGDIPVTGDWNGSGTTKVGIYRSKHGLWMLDYNGNGKFDGPEADRVLLFGGEPGDIPVTGDWDGSGKTKIGVFRRGLWILDWNGNGKIDYPGDVTFGFGDASDIPVVGDWNGSGTSKVGLYRAGMWILDVDAHRTRDPDTNANRVPDARDMVFWFGARDDLPITGDWTGRGKTQVGIFRDSRSWILDTDNGHSLTTAAPPFQFGGVPGDKPVAGKW